MRSSIAGGHPAPEIHVPVLGLRRGRPSDSATTGGARTRPRRGTSFDDVYNVVVLVCLLALIALAVFGGAWIFLTRVTAALPASSPIACADLDGCNAGPEPNEAGAVDDTRSGPTVTR
jgi:hypothetical protein